MATRLRKLLLMLAATIPLVGCAATKVDSPVVVDYPADDADAEMEYWHQLAERPVVSNNEAAHGLIVFEHGSDPTGSYDARLAWLRDNGYGEHFGAAAEDAAKLGSIASTLCRMMDIKGGVTMHVIGPHPRYALRELIYLGIMSPGTQQQGISGIEFVGTLSRAEAHTERQP